MMCIENKHDSSCMPITISKISDETGIPKGTLHQLKGEGKFPSLQHKIGRRLAGFRCKVQEDLDRILSEKS